MCLLGRALNFHMCISMGIRNNDFLACLQQENMYLIENKKIYHSDSVLGMHVHEK